MQLWVLKNWPLRTLVFRKLDTLDSAKIIGRCVEHLRSKGLPHTLLVAAGRAYLFPRKDLKYPPNFGGGKPGLMECSGEYIMHSAAKFQSAKGRKMAQRVRAYLSENVTVGEEAFGGILHECASYFPAAPPD